MRIAILFQRIGRLGQEINECEEGIPHEHWCEDCKIRYKKMVDLEMKLKKEWNVSFGSDYFTPPTPTRILEDESFE